MFRRVDLLFTNRFQTKVVDFKDKMGVCGGGGVVGGGVRKKRTDGGRR